MRDIRLTRRGFCLGTAATLGLAARSARAQSWATLTAQSASVQLAPEGYPATEVWSYDGAIPGPVIRQPQGTRLQRQFVNALPEPSSIHWHGIRIDNAMDGVAGLTQDAVAPGDSFDYDFALPDAGTYWYHAHTNSMEQVGRGLSGALIVEEAEPPEIDRDEVLVLGDWLLNPDTGQFFEPFGHRMALSHGGRMGNLIGTNGRYDLTLPARHNERLRLRLINSANARIFVLRLAGMEGWVMALDGMPLETPEPVTEALILAPAQRVDLIVDVTDETGMGAVMRRDDDDTWRPQVSFSLSGQASATRRPAPAPLPANPNTARAALDGAQSFDLVMQGGAMRGLDSAFLDGRRVDFGQMVAQDQFWALSGQVGRSDMPFAALSRGDVARIRLTNDTIFPHAMHLHGMHFREIRPDGTQGPLRDTILILPDDPREIALVADNPGRWLFHCHMLGHAASGMTTWVEVV